MAPAYIDANFTLSDTDAMCDALGIPCAGQPEIDSTPALLVGLDFETFAESGAISEVGISTLDTRTFPIGNPGENASNCILSINAHHLRVIEVAHLSNQDVWFMKRKKWSGRPDAFELGRSEFIPHTKVKEVLKHVLEIPNRKVYLVCHAAGNEIKMMEDQVQFDLGFLKNRVRILDTQAMKSQKKIETLCAEENIFSGNFHNGGNNAFMTLVMALLHAIGKSAGYLQGLKNVAEVPEGTIPLAPNGMTSSDYVTENVDNGDDKSDGPAPELAALLLTTAGYTHVSDANAAIATAIPSPTFSSPTAQDMILNFRAQPRRTKPFFTPLSRYDFCLRCGQPGHECSQCTVPANCIRCHGKGHMADVCRISDASLDRMIKRWDACFGPWNARVVEIERQTNRRSNNKGGRSSSRGIQGRGGFANEHSGGLQAAISEETGVHDNVAEEQAGGGGALDDGLKEAVGARQTVERQVTHHVVPPEVTSLVEGSTSPRTHDAAVPLGPKLIGAWIKPLK